MQEILNCFSHEDIDQLIALPATNMDVLEIQESFLYHSNISTFS